MKAYLNGATKHYHASSVSELYFDGQSGNDTFQNLTSLKSTAVGGSGNDTLVGGTAKDRLYGGDGNDVLEGRQGNDIVNGGKGNDRYVYSGSNLGADKIKGTTSGKQTLDLRGRGGSNKVDLRVTGWQTVKSKHLSLNLNSVYAIDHVYGSKYSDKIVGNDLKNSIYGNGGNDKIYGSNGRDKLYGGDGDDLVSGNDGSDRVYGGAGNDRVYGGAHNDSLYGGSGNDFVSGSTGNDLAYGGSGNDEIQGGNHNDRLYGGSGRDRIFGEAGHDDLYGGTQDDVLSGGDGLDGLFGGGGRDDMWGGAGADRFLARSGYSLKDVSTSDAVIYFKKGDGGSWKDGEVEAMDKALKFYHWRNGDTTFLKDTISNLRLKIYKAHDSHGWSGLNSVKAGVRSIHMADFNYKNAAETKSAISTMVHEIAHNWEKEGPVWNEFKSKSAWRTYGGSGFVRSRDGDWYYHRNDTFARPYGQTNPYEDFATTMQVYHSIWLEHGRDGIYGSAGAATGIQSKLKVIDKLFNIV